MRATQNEMSVFVAQLFVKVFQRIEARRIHGQHFAHPQGQNSRPPPRPLERRFELVGHAEEKCAENTKNKHFLRHLFADQRMVSAFGVGTLVHRHDLRCFGDALDEKNGRQNHADFYGHGQIGEHC